MNNPDGSGFRQCNCLAFDSPAAASTSAGGSGWPCYWLNEGDTCALTVPPGPKVGDFDVN